MSEPEPELLGDDVIPLEDDTIEDQIDGEHPDGDWDKWNPSIYDDDPDAPDDDIDPAVDEDEEVD